MRDASSAFDRVAGSLVTVYRSASPQPIRHRINKDENARAVRPGTRPALLDKRALI
jgi:hypothetical protein